MAANKSRLGWFRFSLRALFFAVTLFAVWLAFLVHAANQQKRAVELIEASGGRVRYSYQYFLNGKPVPSAKPPGPDWLRRAIGDHYFVTAQSVIFKHGSFTYYNLEDGAVLTSIVREPVNDQALACLKDLPGLTSVGLQLVDIGDESLAHIANLKRLRLLHLNGTRVTDRGLEQLKSLRALEVLDLRETDVSPPAVQTLAEALPKTRINAEQTRRRASESSIDVAAPK